MKRNNGQIIVTALLFVMLTLFGCGKSEISENAISRTASITEESEAVRENDTVSEKPETVVAEATSGNYDSYAGVETTTESYDVVSADESSSKAVIDEYGIYDSKDEVALYIVTYDKLPSNYITKKEAKKLGWSGGSLESYAPGKCIGGDYFGNYEGNLPEDAQYHECDIDTLGKKSRGAKRIVYSDDGYIYYTEDHYETFELLYEP
ncbi:ribonuclease [Butyrivibrio proteoclasticus]|uniref:Ribonuclease n=1 Tax=Butyrivibrio proteoclasticus TaxID=43305 RepID=A0A1I5WFN9_9FIRM|nr:ribonuclease domain-containing protein [Butyrivibrio proteoclasticus]SFQ18398.1 ribonuclease [Butyrivibrio proteoclasticus]